MRADTVRELLCLAPAAIVGLLVYARFKSSESESLSDSRKHLFRAAAAGHPSGSGALGRDENRKPKWLGGRRPTEQRTVASSR